MSGKKYYAERKGLASNISLDFEKLRQAFFYIYKTLESKYYLQQAIGYVCVDAEDGYVQGRWGSNPKIFVLMELRNDSLWPISSNIRNYSESDLFTMIEFLHDHVSEPTKGQYHTWNDCGWHYYEFDQEVGQEEFRQQINRFLAVYDKGYNLTQGGEIQIIPPSGMTPLITQPIVTQDPQNIDERVDYAVRTYLHHSSGLQEKKDAVRTLADVLEYLQKSNIRFTKKDEGTLFQIINEFDIRHHRKNQQGVYDKELFYEWMFYTFLASIKLLVNYMLKTGQQIP